MTRLAPLPETAQEKSIIAGAGHLSPPRAPSYTPSGSLSKSRKSSSSSKHSKSSSGSRREGGDEDKGSNNNSQKKKIQEIDMFTVQPPKKSSRYLYKEYNNVPNKRP